MPEAVRIGPLPPSLQREALALAARSFVDEPFLVEMVGDDPVERLAAARDHFAADLWTQELQLGAFVGEILVGVCLVAPPGHCEICSGTDPSSAPDDPDRRIGWEFAVNVQAAHQPEGEHAWLRLVAVEPVVQGAGIGRALVASAVAALADQGASCVLLECEPRRAAFYEHAGFRARTSFFDPSSGSDASLLRADLRR